MSSIKEVALRAGVSISTVSNVLNGTKYVSEPLRRKVNIAVKELGYEADPVARNMKRKSTKTIGIISADICGLFYPYVIKGIYEVAYEKGYQVIICDTNGISDSFSSIDREKEGFKSLVNNRVDGIIFCSQVTQSIEGSYINEIKKMVSSKKKTALVSVERDFSKYGIDSIFVDSHLGAKNATLHLLEKGCKKVGHIMGPIFSKVSLDRVKGYKEAMSECGLKVDDDKMIVSGDYSHQKGYSAMKELMNTMPDLDGVFVANDQMAIGACRALKDLGKRIPEDVKVIGYDNVFVSSVVDPPLSTIHVRKRHIGREAVNALFEQIENKLEEEKGRVINMETKLIVRKSTDPEAPEDWILNDW